MWEGPQRPESRGAEAAPTLFCDRAELALLRDEFGNAARSSPSGAMRPAIQISIVNRIARLLFRVRNENRRDYYSCLLRICHEYLRCSGCNTDRCTEMSPRAAHAYSPSVLRHQRSLSGRLDCALRRPARQAGDSNRIDTNRCTIPKRYPRHRKDRTRSVETI